VRLSTRNGLPHGASTTPVDQQALAALIIAIANTNVWNRLNVSTKSFAGVWKA
jgi:hypothetical protein